MSRGLGDLQRRVCEVLYVDGDGELPLRELRRRLGDPDRSTLRRAIRGLLERGMVEVESGPGGEQRVALEVWTYIAMGGDRPAFLAVRPDPAHGEAGRPGGAAEDAPRTGHRIPLPGKPEGPRWFRDEHSFLCDRPLGETQKTILGVLNRYARPPQEGMSLTLVKAFVDADRSNLRRAIRTLLLRGLLEESEGGDRVRLSPSGARAASSLPVRPSLGAAPGGEHDVAVETGPVPSDVSGFEKARFFGDGRSLLMLSLKGPATTHPPPSWVMPPVRPHLQPFSA